MKKRLITVAVGAAVAASAAIPASSAFGTIISGSSPRCLQLAKALIAAEQQAPNLHIVNIRNQQFEAAASATNCR